VARTLESGEDRELTIDEFFAEAEKLREAVEAR
jgi:hypothetical protein